jgi:hypothetical protein
VERAELDIADLTLSANNPYLASSLVPPAARPFPVAKVVSGVLIGFAVAGAAAWLLTHPATVASHTAVRAPRQSTQVVAEVAPAVSTETVAKISAQPIQPTSEIATKAAEVPVPTKAPEAVAPIKRVAPVVAEAKAAVVAATTPVEPNAAAPVAAVEPVAAPKAELTAPAATTIAPTPAEPAVLGSEDVALPEALTREQVVAGFESTREALLQCAAGKHGIVTLTTTIANSGRVSRAVVEGVFQGSPEGSCMARAVRSARFQRFSQQSLNVTYPISL